MQNEKENNQPFLGLAMMVTLTAVTASAAEITDPAVEEQIQPRYSFTNSTATSIGILEDGTAIANGSVTGYPGIADKVHIKLELQQLTKDENNNDKWVTLETWEETFNRYRGTLEKQMAVGHGTYRAFATYTVYSGDQAEIIGSSSQSQTY